ncbi:MAG TPA: patatin-like phospholipase family protein [Xanthobacteraceae bacterium]|nr:patatin-like phospholipase family protein [Xanthobacteraceae bacterium]
MASERGIEHLEIGEFTSLAALLLSQPQLGSSFAALDQSDLAELEASVEWYGVSAGTTLFQQGDPASNMLLVTAGRLGIFVDVGLGPQLVEQVRPGEFTGEMALISNEPRSATVVALRNTELISVPICVAEKLIHGSPRLMLALLRQLAGRLRDMTLRSPPKRSTKALAVIPLDRTPINRELRNGLFREFAALSQRSALIDSSKSHLTTELMAGFEDQHDLVIYFADDRRSPWTRRCLGQADRVIFLADAGSALDDEARQEINDVRGLHRPADLVLLTHADARRPAGATPWLECFAPHEIFHVRRGNAVDYARVARLAMGCAIGVVFSGGGARGFAHIGAIRALYAAGIPIDLVGGTSMGAIVAGAAALGGDAGAIEDMFRHAFVRNNPLNDYTLPLIALLRGRKMSRLLRYHFEDATIENLWKVFFCVSANLSTGKSLIHQRGLLWRALRASAAIPGILPPATETGDVLVDGGIMNNFPTDIMRSLARGRVIGIEVGSEVHLVARASDPEERSLLWLFRNRRTATPGILEILMRVGTVGGDQQRAANRLAVDLFIQPTLNSVGLLSLDQFDNAIEKGYRATMEAIERASTTASSITEGWIPAHAPDAVPAGL